MCRKTKIQSWEGEGRGFGCYCVFCFVLEVEDPVVESWGLNNARVVSSTQTNLQTFSFFFFLL